MIRNSIHRFATLAGQTAAIQMRPATGWDAALRAGLECADNQQKPNGLVRCDLVI